MGDVLFFPVGGAWLCFISMQVLIIIGSILSVELFVLSLHPVSSERLTYCLKIMCKVDAFIQQHLMVPEVPLSLPVW